MTTDNAILRKDGATGSNIQESLVTIDDTGSINIPTGETYDINGTPHSHAGVGTQYGEFTIPPTWSSNDGNYAVRGVGSVNVDFYFSFRVPKSFSSLTECVVGFIALGTQVGMTFDVTVSYGANGESKTANSESVTPTAGQDVTTDFIHELDLSGVLTGIAAGDWVGVAVDRNTAPSINVLGLSFRYVKA